MDDGGDGFVRMKEGREESEKKRMKKRETHPCTEETERDGGGREREKKRKRDREKDSSRGA